MGGEVQITEDQRLQTRCARRRSRMGRWRRMSSSSSKTTSGSGGGRWAFRGCVAVSLALLGGVEPLVILIRRVLGVLGVFIVDCCGSKIEQPAIGDLGNSYGPCTSARVLDETTATCNT
jgi:hypothetical protein